MIRNSEFKVVVNGILGKLSSKAKQKFYGEVRNELAKGRYEELAISEALKKIGIKDPLKFDIKKGIDAIYEGMKME